MGTQLNKQGTTNKEYKLLYCDSKVPVHVLRVASAAVSGTKRKKTSTK